MTMNSQIESDWKCQHNALRRCKEPHQYPFNAYVCGNCSQVFQVDLFRFPEPEKPEPMGKKIPWGLRARQA